MSERIIDYAYIAENITNISRINVRVYQNDQLVCYQDVIHFPKDPADLYVEELLSFSQKISYYITPFSQYYGVIRQDDHVLIIGPTYQIPPTRAQIREFMFLLGLKEHYFEQYQSLLNTITPMPLDMFLHFLCLVYYFVSDEKLNMSELMLFDSSGEISMQDVKQRIPPAPADVTPRQDVPLLHDTLTFEEQMLSLVAAGDTEGLSRLFATTTAGQSGKMAATYLRQVQNLFITTATLVSRAAIRGGLPGEEALSLSDRYIQHCESYNNPEQVLNLQYHMVLDYAHRVQELGCGESHDRFMRQVASYVREHLTENLSVADIAHQLYISPSHLSTKFKRESGLSLNHYIRRQKIKKAQELLKDTDRSLMEISTYLGFSSQGYFQNVFKQITGMTPREYRERA